MRKIFSTVLVATALLFSMQANAVVIEVSQWGGDNGLKAAFTNANKTSDLTQIKLTASILDLQECLFVDGGNIELDMNNFNLTMPDDYGKTLANPTCFTVKHGNLNIIGKGTITNATKSYNAKLENGSYLPTYTGKSTSAYILVASVRGAATDLGPDYSVLTIGKDVTLTVTPSDPNAFPVTSKTSTYNLGGKVGVDINHTSSYASYGAVVNIYGTVYGNKYGAQVSGNVKQTSGTIPVMNIYPGATCTGSAYDTQAVGVYVGGYAQVNMQGEAVGATGMFVKSGDVNIEDATISSNWQGAYQDPADGKRTGVEAGGSGLVVQSANVYAGHMNVDIAGTSKITGTSGYAVDECIDSDVAGSKVENLTIESGSFSTTGVGETPGKGTIIVSDDSKNNVEVTGGKWSDQAAVTQGLVDPTKGGFVIETEDEKGNTVYTISNTGTGTAVAWDSINKMTGETQNTYFKIKDARDVKAADSEDGTVKAKYIWMVAGATLTIKDGATVVVDQVLTEYISGDPDTYSQIVVEAGGKLLVTGYQGLYSPNAECLVLKDNGTKRGVFAFNPAVGDNKSPFATVEYFAKNSHALDATSNDWDIFVSPFVKIDYIKSNFTDEMRHEYRTQNTTWFQVWNGTAWVNQTSSWIKSNVKAFDAIAITNASAEDKFVTYTFKGQLQGNISGEFDLAKGFMYLGNGFVAPMNSQKILDQLTDPKLDKSFYIWKGQEFMNITKDNAASQLPNMDAMGFFIVKTTGATKLTLDYNTLIWEYNNK